MILDDYQVFLDKIISKVGFLGIDVSTFNLDHLGYQASSDEDYYKNLPEALSLGKKVHENLVGGRLVSIFKLNTPIEYRNYHIEALELIAPKKDQIVESHLDHVEFVIDKSFEEFMNEYPSVNWDTSAVDQPTFPMLKVQLGEGLIVKFHYEPVLKIVEKEEKPL